MAGIGYPGEKPPGEHVAILLAIKNGHRFLAEQLQSYVSQTHGDWSLHVSDDGSSDASGDLISSFAQTQPHQVTFRKGPREGYCQNFMTLAQDRELKGDYFAFSDQDDVWYADKLERALRFLRTIPPTKPAFYCSRTELVDETGAHLGFSPRFTKPPTFQNAIVQNIGGGNTIVFNVATKRLLESIGGQRVVSHDWWTYQAVSAVGGEIFYDSNPSVKYRQHDQNIIGSNDDVDAKLRRLQMMLTGKVAEWNETNLSALQSLRPRFMASAQATLEAFMAARQARSLAARLYYLHQSGVYRQTVMAQFGLVVAACLRKL